MIKKSIKKTVPICTDNKSTRGGRSKQYDVFNIIKNYPIINDIKEKILLNLQTCLQLKVKNLKLLSAWTVLGHKNSYHLLHNHNDKKDHIASVLYLKVPDLKSKEEGNFYYVYQKNNKTNYGTHHPKKGDLIIFPIWLLHGVYPQPKGLRQTLNLDFEICE
jgi:hypothetical protein